MALFLEPCCARVKHHVYNRVHAKKKAQDQAKNTRDRGGDEEEWPHLAGNWQENKISSTLTKTSQKKEEHCPA